MRNPKVVAVCFQQNHGNTLLTTGRIRDNFEAEGTGQDVHKQRSGRPLTSASPVSSAVVLQRFTREQQKINNTIPVHILVDVRHYLSVEFSSA